MGIRAFQGQRRDHPVQCKYQQFNIYGLTRIQKPKYTGFLCFCLVSDCPKTILSAIYGSEINCYGIYSLQRPHGLILSFNTVKRSNQAAVMQILGKVEVILAAILDFRHFGFSDWIKNTIFGFLVLENPHIDQLGKIICSQDVCIVELDNTSRSGRSPRFLSWLTRVG